MYRFTLPFRSRSAVAEITAAQAAAAIPCSADLREGTLRKINVLPVSRPRVREERLLRGRSSRPPPGSALYRLFPPPMRCYQLTLRNSSRNTRRSVVSNGSFFLLMCSRSASLMRLW